MAERFSKDVKRINLKISKELNDYLSEKSFKMGIPKNAICSMWLEQMKQNDQAIELVKQTSATINTAQRLISTD